LIDRARAQPHPVAVLVYGLINFDSYFRGREIAEHLRLNDAARYPHLETAYKYFTSFRPAYRSNLIRLAKMANEELQAMIIKLDHELADNSTVQLRYSDALATADLSRAELLHPIDGWHASVEGHNVLAEAVFRDLEPSLRFLGLK
jgi:lysophospholipase L1-like esterase